MPRRARTSVSKPQTAKLKSWSYSTWNMWRKCARRIYYSKIEKRPDPMGTAAQRGIRIHEMAEKFIKGSLAEIPAKGVGKELVHFKDDLLRLRNSPTAKAELDFTFTDDWTQTHWRDWDNAWVRIKVDVFDRPDPKTITIIDLKTGQYRDYDTQLELYGLGGFKAYPEVERVVGEIWYIDEGFRFGGDCIDSIEFTKDEEPALQELWESRAAPMMADTNFVTSPGPDCSWCPFSRQKGGPCVDG